MALERRTPLRRTELRRGGQLARTGELRRTGRLERRTRLTVKPHSGRTPEEQAVWEQTKILVGHRSGWRCEARRSSWCSGDYEHAHHRLRRGQGGPDTVENTLATCHACHDEIHQHPAVSYEVGHLIRRTTP